MIKSLKQTGEQNVGIRKYLPNFVLLSLWVKKYALIKNWILVKF